MPVISQLSCFQKPGKALKYGLEKPKHASCSPLVETGLLWQVYPGFWSLSAICVSSGLISSSLWGKMKKCDEKKIYKLKLKWNPDKSEVVDKYLKTGILVVCV